MQLHDLKPNEGSKKNRKRIGRGIGSGVGKTSGRGTKGQNARHGGVRQYHQGGNLPFFRKLPFMRGEGFSPLSRTRYNEINLDLLKDFKAGSEVTPEKLAEAGLVKDSKKPIKILGRGEISAALNIKAHKVTDGAREKIERAGGSVETIAD
ncbi:MAG: 50S ribosomal protein L15 [Anaerolineaceae bacterium]|nr:50S ribosomal protein L15 [Anaerolineaceae bacterium]